MRYLDKLLESLETSGPKKKGKPNNFKLLKTLVHRGQAADKAGDKLDKKYIKRHTKTGRGASEDEKQDQTLNKLSATGKEAEKSFTQADKLASKVHLKGGGKGDGKPRGKLRLAHAAYQQIGDIIAEARKKLNYKDETDRAIAADKKLKTARGNFRTAKPGSKDQTSALTRQERALKVKQGRLKRAADKMDSIQSHTSYQQIGDVLAEAMFGKIRTKAANKLDDISRKQYKKGESDEASGKPKRAGMRGRAAHYAGKLAQRVRPKEKSK